VATPHEIPFPNYRSPWLRAGLLLTRSAPIAAGSDTSHAPPIPSICSTVGPPRNHMRVGCQQQLHGYATLPTVRDLCYPLAGSSLLVRMEPAIGGFGISWCRAACPPMGCTGHIPG
jgi:hypothetical protein